MDSHSLIERIRNEDSEQCLKEVYKKYRNELFLWEVRQHSCTMDEAKDVFQQTMIIFYENIIYKRLTDIKTQVKTYLFGIGKNKIHELVRDKSKQNSQFNDQIYVTADYYYQDADDSYEDQLNLVETCLDQLGDPCRRILAQYYYQKKTMLQISESLGYKNSETVKNLKYKCLQRLRQIVSSSVAL